MSWIYEGETSDATVLSSCPVCRSVVPERFTEEHLKWHSLRQCACDADFTDGTGWCQQCGKQRVHAEAT